MVAQDPITMYIKRVKGTPPHATPHLRTQIDYYPHSCWQACHVRRVTWHPGADTEMTTFSTIVKSEMVYDANQHITANGAEVTDFNLHCYNGGDYSPLMC